MDDALTRRGVLRVGIDLTAVSEVASSIDRFGARYLDRVYRAGEQRACAGDDSTRARCLAGRFAAKEAVLKVLEPVDDPVAWSDIEIRRGPSGAPQARLHGTARALAHKRRLQSLTLSLSHEGDVAAAVAVGEVADTADQEDPPWT